MRSSPWLLALRCVYRLLLSHLHFVLRACCICTHKQFTLTQVYNYRTLASSAALVGMTAFRVWWSGMRDFPTMEDFNQIAFQQDRLVRVLSFHYVYCWNALLLVFPSSLCYTWGPDAIPLVRSLADVRNLASLLLWVSLAYAVLWTLGTRDPKPDPDPTASVRPSHECRISQVHVSHASRASSPAQTAHPRLAREAWAMALAFLVLPFVPASGALVETGFVLAERVLYLPSVSVCLVAGFVFSRQLKQNVNRRGDWMRKLFVGSVLLLAVGFAIINYSSEYQ
jgi:hypothetical protein